MSAEVFVFADWEEFEEPTLVGTLRSSAARQKEHFSFSYDTDWLQSPCAQQIDPELNLYSGEQHGEDDKNFRVFLDSCPLINSAVTSPLFIRVTGRAKIVCNCFVTHFSFLLRSLLTFTVHFPST